MLAACLSPRIRMPQDHPALIVPGWNGKLAHPHIQLREVATLPAQIEGG